MHDAGEFWEELLAQIEAGQIVPVVGPELLTVTVDGRDILLYRVVAERLLAKYGLVAATDSPAHDGQPDTTAVSLRPYHELNDAVSALIQRGRRMQDLYRPIHDLIKTIGDESASLQPLRDLASITGFTLFVTTTPDDWLTRAIDAERHEGIAKTDPIVFAPKLGSGMQNDLPATPSSSYTAVCYLFGKASPSPFLFAIHDEDVLEFIHNLQINAAEAMKRLFSELQQRNLLLIGCNFGDWLCRFFIRISNTQRLADNRSKREFLIEQSSDTSGSLTTFLERFSPDSWVFGGTAREFVAELSRRWQERHPHVSPSPTAATVAATRARADETLFISYSRTDLAAARQLFADLQEIGADVAWFDKADIKPGDVWEQTTKSAIDRCYLFLAVVSTNTENREEGFFREEWALATERSRRIQGRKFLVPVVVDRDYDGNAGRFRLVPDNFFSLHFGHAPDGHLSADLRTELITLIRERRTARAG